MARVKRDLKEILIENMLVRRVKEAGGICIKVQTIGRRGFFDRLVVLRGRVFFVELKRPKGGIVSAHQADRHRTFKNCGARVAIVLSEEDIDRVLCF